MGPRSRRGDAAGLRLPPQVALPPQHLVWQTELSAPVDGAGTVALERLAASGDHFRLTAQGRLDAATLGGDAHVTLALEDLTPLVEPYGQRVAGAAELEANFAVGARAEVIGIDLYGKADALTGLPEGVGALVGSADAASQRHGGPGREHRSHAPAGQGQRGHP